jgi:hypothetical protein
LQTSFKKFFCPPQQHECELGFPSLLQIKTKHRSRLNLEGDIWCTLSSTDLRIKKLAEAK